jgi:hypothetical protein
MLLDYGVRFDYRFGYWYYVIVKEQVVCSGRLSEWVDGGV